MSNMMEGSLARTAPRRRLVNVQDDGSDESLAIAGQVPLATEEKIVLHATQLRKTYRKGKHEIAVLKGCDFAAPRVRQTIGDKSGQSVEALRAVEGRRREREGQRREIVPARKPRLVVDEVDRATADEVPHD